MIALCGPDAAYLRGQPARIAHFDPPSFIAVHGNRTLLAPFFAALSIAYARHTGFNALSRSWYPPTR
jgi:hypothetical protein